MEDLNDDENTNPPVTIHCPDSLLEAKFDYSPKPATAQADITFTNISTGATKYRWYFGGADSLLTITKKAIVRHYNGLGSYNVILVAESEAGCIDTFRYSLNVQCPDSLLKAQFDYSPKLATAPADITFTNLSNGAVKYHWYFGGADSVVNTSDAPIIRHYDGAQTFSVKLVAENVNGCRNTISKEIMVGDTSKFHFSYPLSNLINNFLSPVAISQLDNGDYSILYQSYGLKHVLIGKNGLMKSPPISAAGISPDIELTSVTRGENGKYYACGHQNNQAVLLMFNAEIVVESMTTFMFNDDALKAIPQQVHFKAGNILIAGYDTKDNLNKPGIAVFNTQGQLLSKGEIKDPDFENYNLIVKMGQLTDNSYRVVVGNAIDDQRYRILDVGNDFISRGSVKLPVFSFVSAITSTPDNGYIYNVATAHPQFQYFTYEMVKNQNFTQQWSIPLPTTATPLIDSDGNILLCYRDNGDLNFIKYDSNATLLWSKKIEEPGNPFLSATGIIQTSDGGYAILGEAYKNGISQLHLVKTDKDGNYE